jgi:hypothetical protein
MQKNRSVFFGSAIVLAAAVFFAVTAVVAAMPKIAVGAGSPCGTLTTGDCCYVNPQCPANYGPGWSLPWGCGPINDDLEACGPTGTGGNNGPTCKPACNSSADCSSMGPLGYCVDAGGCNSYCETFTCAAGSVPCITSTGQNVCELGTSCAPSQTPAGGGSAAPVRATPGSSGSGALNLNGNLQSGGSFNLTLTGGPTNKAFSFCADQVLPNGHDQGQSCSPETTDASGNWSVSGSWSDAEIGSWTETTGISNSINFTIAPKGSKPACNNDSECPHSGEKCIQAGTSQAYCSPVSASGYIYLAGEPSAIANALAAAPMAVLQPCSWTNTDLVSLQTCEDIYVTQAETLGYSASCSNISNTMPGIGTTYAPYCVVSGTGVLGSLNGYVDIPYSTVSGGSGWSTVGNCAANQSCASQSTSANSFCSQLNGDFGEPGATVSVAAGPSSGVSAPSFSCTTGRAAGTYSGIPGFTLPPSLTGSPTTPPAASGGTAITSVRGYNPANGGTFTANTAVAGTQLFLAGTFAASGNTVSVVANGGSVIGGTSYGVTVLSQSATSIDISLGNIPPGSSYVVTVSSPLGTASASFTVTGTASSSSPIFSISGAPGNSFTVGQAWTLSLSGGPAKAAFDLCTDQTLPNGHDQGKSCTNGLSFGTADPFGAWTKSGSFPLPTADYSVVGSWKEWLVFASGATSNQIQFTVGAASGGAPPGTSGYSIAGVQGQTSPTNFTPSSAIPQGAYLILYGNFDPVQTDDIIWAQGLSSAASLVTSYVSATQINASLAGLAPGSYTVSIQSPSGWTNSMPFTIVAASGGSGFPKTITVGNVAVNVRSAPKVSTSNIVGSLLPGSQFIATDEVAGDSVSGNNLWWVTAASDGVTPNYVWSGGTDAAAPGEPPPGSPVFSISVAGTSGNSFTVGQAWTLSLSGGPAKAAFDLCTDQTLPNGQDQGQSCAPNFGTSDISGSWTQPGSFPVPTASYSVVGLWKEWLAFSSGATSNQIQFTVAAAPGGTPPPSQPTLAGVQGYDPAAKTYANGSAAPGDYLILYGAFGLSGGSVSIDGKAVPAGDVWQGAAGAPSPSSPDQANVSPDGISGLAAGSSNSVTVTTSAGLTTNSLPFTVAAAPGGTPPPATPPSSAFPKTITVGSGGANVRSKPNTTDVPSNVVKTLAAGSQFTATDEVAGQNISGNDQWWVAAGAGGTSNYVWSGGADAVSSGGGGGGGGEDPAVSACFNNPSASGCGDTISGFCLQHPSNSDCANYCFLDSVAPSCANVIAIYCGSNSGASACQPSGSNGAGSKSATVSVAASGFATPATYTFTAGGTLVGAYAESQSFTVKAGSSFAVGKGYAITSGQVPDQTSLSGDCSDTAVAGNTYECSATYGEGTSGASSTLSVDVAGDAKLEETPPIGYVVAANPDAYKISGDYGSGVDDLNLAPGATFKVTDTDADDLATYDLATSGTCSGTAVTGQSYSCTLTYALKNSNTAQLDVSVVGDVPDAGAGYEITADPDAYDAEGSFSDSGSKKLAPGASFGVDGDGVDGYSVTMSGTCKGTAAAGQTYACTVAYAQSVCTPNATQDCESSANACNLVYAGTQTCKSDGSGWGTCSETSAPADSECAAYCADHSNDPDCATWCAEPGNASACGESGGGNGGGGGADNPCLTDPDGYDCADYCAFNPNDSTCLAIFGECNDYDCNSGDCFCVVPD